MKSNLKSIRPLLGILALTAISLASRSEAQLISSYTEGPANAWSTDVTTGKFIDLPIGANKALAADNATNRLFGSAGTNLVTFEVNAARQLVFVSSRNIREGSGLAVDQVVGMGFGNGVIYASVAQRRAGVGAVSGLYSINPSTAIAVRLVTASTTFPTFKGLDFNPQDGHLYAVSGPSKAQSIVKINPSSFQISNVSAVPASAYSSISADFDGVAVGEGKVFLTSGYALLPISVYDIASGTFGQKLTNPDRKEQNNGGATFLAAITGADINPGPPVPPRLRGVTLSTLGVAVSWDRNLESDVVSYAIFRSSDALNFTEIGRTITSDFMDSTAGAGTTFTYFVTAIDKGGNESNRSNTLNVTTPAGPGAAPVVFVTDLSPGISIDSRTKTAQGVANITVRNQTGQPAAGATVTVKFGGSFNETISGTTGSAGTVRLTTRNRVPSPATVQVTVTNITAPGFTYEPSRNTETTDSK